MTEHEPLRPAGTPEDQRLFAAHGPRPRNPPPEPPARTVIAVCSGKGGVGKSTIALNLAVALGLTGDRVGLLDADLEAPDIPLMMGIARRTPARRWTLSRVGGFGATPLQPVTRHGIALMSAGFIIAEDQALAWPADMAEALLNQLIWSTTWGPLDTLVVDLPPGISPIVQALFRRVPTVRALLVVTPQDVAHLDNRRLLAALQTAGIRPIGGIENMSGLACPHCGHTTTIFPPAPAERTIWAREIRRLGSIPFTNADHQDNTEPVIATAPTGTRATALRDIAAAVRAALT